MDLRTLKTLIELVEGSGLTELDVTEGEEKVRIVKGVAAGSYQQAYMVAQPQPLQMAPPPAAAPAAIVVEAEPKGVAVKAPMVGTFYRSGSPGAKPYVEIGSEVKVGDVLCIIEAMKLMNEIQAEHAGTITLAALENGQPVEYGQTLFVIE